MTNPQAEPSMEDILASIRRIISEDEEEANASEQSGEPVGDAASANEAGPVSDDDQDASLDNGDEVDGHDTQQEAGEGDAQGEAESEEDLAILNKLEALTKDDFAHPGAKEAAQQQSGDAYELSKQSGDDAPQGQALDALRAEDNVVPIQDDETQAEEKELGMVGESSAAATTKAFDSLSETVRIANKESGATLEDIVVQMVNPMIKEWLDANLPAIVEQAVEDEVQRLARRRR